MGTEPDEGHLFLVEGDLTRVSCDAWLLPTDGSLRIEEPWRSTAGPLAQARFDSHLYQRPDGDFKELPNERRGVLLDEDWWCSGPECDHGLHQGEPRTWLADVGGVEGDPLERFTEPVENFVRRAAADPGLHSGHGRLVPLLALPLVGTRFAGGEKHLLRLLEAHIHNIEELLTNGALPRTVDVALVLYRPPRSTEKDAFSYAQWVRKRRLSEEGDDGEPAWSQMWPGLDHRHWEAAQELAAEVDRDGLVLFVGSGVSVGAGLPVWTELVALLAEEAELDMGELEGLPIVDQAAVIERAMARKGGSLEESVAKYLDGRRYGLQHALLAGLHVTEMVTTNYDVLLERAIVGAGETIRVLPYEPAAARDDRWLLKLHGTIQRPPIDTSAPVPEESTPPDIVLTRKHYLQFDHQHAALMGIVQAMLVTRHMAFVGFGLTDDNFHRLVDEVRTALAPGQGVDSGGEERVFGTALMLHDSGALRRLWEDDLRFVDFETDSQAGGSGDGVAAAARRSEIFLDMLGTLAFSRRTYILQDDFEEGLRPSEEVLRESLLQLADRVAVETPDGGSVLDSDIAGPVRELLEGYGWEQPGGRT